MVRSLSVEGKQQIETAHAKARKELKPIPTDAAVALLLPLICRLLKLPPLRYEFNFLVATRFELPLRTHRRTPHPLRYGHGRVVALHGNINAWVAWDENTKDLGSQLVGISGGRRRLWI
jgi:hypothetical protein